MADQVYVIPRLDDKSVLDLFRAVITKHRPDGCKIEPAGLRTLNFLSPSKDEQQILDRLDSTASFIISRIYANYKGLQVAYMRGGEKPSSIFDEIKVIRRDDQNAIDPNVGLDIISLLADKVGLRNAGALLVQQQGGRLDDLDALYQSTVLRLETSFAEQIKKITDWTVEQAEFLKNQKIHLAEETSSERAKLADEHAAFMSELEKREDELAKRQKELDDRDYMHARRATRGDIQKVISDRQKEFTLTPQTRRLRIPIHLVLILTTVVLLGLSVLNFRELFALNWTMPSYVLLWALAKQGSLAIVLIGTLYFYVRWMNRWFEQHAMAEFLLKEFQLDIDRASWVVETALEWRRTAHEELPEPLLRGITRNLFVRIQAEETKLSAADELASALMGNAAGLKLKVGDSELAFTRRGIGKLSKTEIKEAAE
jgi:hypothetical protein